MHCTTKRYSFSALLMSALIFTACSEGNPKQSMTPGGTVADAGASANPDAASNGTPDSGIRTDAGPTGPCPPNFPGCRCSNPDDPMGMAMPMGAKSCADPPIPVPNAMAATFSNCLVGISIGDFLGQLAWNAFSDYAQGKYIETLGKGADAVARQAPPAIGGGRVRHVEHDLRARFRHGGKIEVLDVEGA